MGELAMRLEHDLIVIVALSSFDGPAVNVQRLRRLKLMQANYTCQAFTHNTGCLTPCKHTHTHTHEHTHTHTHFTLYPFEFVWEKQ